MEPRHFWALVRAAEDETGSGRRLSTDEKDELLDLLNAAKAEHAETLKLGVSQ